MLSVSYFRKKKKSPRTSVSSQKAAKGRLFVRIFKKKSDKETAEKTSLVYRRIILSYALCALVCSALIFAITAYKTYSIIHENIEQSNLATVQKLQTDMESVLGDTDTVSYTLQGTPAIKKLFTMSKTVNPSWVTNEELMNIVHLLRKQKALHSYVDDMAILFRDVDLIVDTSSPHLDYDEFFSRKYSFESESFSGISDLDFTGDSRLIPNCSVGKYSHPNNSRIIYFKSIPNAAGIPKALLMVTLKPEALRQMFNQGLVPKNGGWIITDRDNTAFLTSFSEDVTAPQKQAIDRMQRQLKNGENGQTNSPTTTWSGVKAAYYGAYSGMIQEHFYVYFNMGSIYRQYAGALIYALIALAAALAAGILLAGHMAKRSYTPIRRLMEAVSFIDYDDATADEYTLIEGAVQKLSAENSSLRSNIARHMPIIRNRLLGDLLTNAPLSLSMRRELEHCLVIFDAPWYCVCIISVELMQLAFEQPLDASPATRALLLTYIEDYVQSLIPHAYVTESGSQTYGVICNGQEEQLGRLKEHLTGLSSHLRRLFAPDYDVEMTIGLSECRREPPALKPLYIQADTAVKTRYTWGSQEVVCYSGLAERQKVSYSFTFNDELKLINLMKSGQAEEATAFANHVLDDFFGQGRVKREDGIYIFNQLLFCCAKVLHEYQIRVTEHIDFQALPSFTMFTQMNEYTLDAIKKTCEISQNRQADEGEELSSQIVSYIRHHYAAYDLTLGALAEVFHISAIYASKCIKKETGFTFVEFISRYRTDAAKELLTKGNATVKEIAAMVGYDSDKSFIRVFKKYTGLTPGQYRKTGG